uniref:Major facilitator superfamily (MFS) profile domain-containing protein n=1 Tax=Ditylenchus dipsaci TaxID=166011 RepID=A0A915CV44_9BILA
MATFALLYDHLKLHFIDRSSPSFATGTPRELCRTVADITPAFVLTPFIINPYILSPNIMVPYLLSPLIISPLILSQTYCRLWFLELPSPVKREARRKRIDSNHQYKHFEDVLEQVNPFGVYQIFVCICICIAQIEWAGNFSFINMVGSLEPQWACQLKDGSGEQIIMPPTRETDCKFIKENCASISYIKNQSEFTSIVASFKLICEDGDKPEVIQMAQAISLMIGSIVGGHLGDNYGRQFLFYMSQLGIVITSCMTTASTSWLGYAFTQCLNGFLYGVVEVESLTLVLEYTNNKYRMIPIACFQWNIANMSIALLAKLTTFVYHGPNGTNWQMFFVFLNTITSPVIMAFMLLYESPRWLIAKGKMSQACEVLNDLADKRWNGTEAVFSTENLKSIRHDTSNTFYNFYHLFYNERFAKQSFMQILSVFTHSMIAMSYFFIIRDLMGVIFLAVVVLMGVFGHAHNHLSVMILVIVGDHQRYPTVIRCIAFGCLHSVKHIGTVVGFIYWRDSAGGVFLQPDTKGKALLDMIDEKDYTRVETALPKALFRMAAMHRVMQSELHSKLAAENRDKWDDWRRELQNRDSTTGLGQVNQAAELSDDEEQRESHTAKPLNGSKSVAFGNPPSSEQHLQKDALNSELKKRTK